MTIQQATKETILQQSRVLKYVNRLNRESDIILTQMDGDVLDLINREYGARESTRQSRLAETEAELEEVIKQYHTELRNKHLSDLDGLVEVEETASNNIIEALIGTAVAASILEAANRRRIARNTLADGFTTGEWFSRQAADTLTRLKRQIRNPIIAGQVSNARAGVRDILNKTRAGVAGIIRSTTVAVANKTRETVYALNPNVKAVQQITVFDSRTSKICASYGGKAWALPDYTPIGHSLPYNGGPPRHFNCRSTIRPLASTTGIPADVEFESWLKEQDTATANAILGDNRAKLWREGKLKLDEMVDKTGLVLTLEQIKSQITK